MPIPGVGPAGAKNNVFQTVQSAAGGVKFGTNVVVSATVQADNAQDATNLGDTLKLLASMAQLQAKGEMLVLDVRDAESYRRGHLPGAVLMPLETVESHAAELRTEKRPIVTSDATADAPSTPCLRQKRTLMAVLPRLPGVTRFVNFSATSSWVSGPSGTRPSTDALAASAAVG